MTKLKNDWSVKITDPETGAVVIEEKLENATREQEIAFRTRLRQHITTPTNDACRQSAAHEEDVGTLSWYGGPTASQVWTLYKCGACGQIHGRLSMIS